MVTRDHAWPTGTPCWVDLAADDFGRAKVFYAGLFGWQLVDWPLEPGRFVVCMRDGRVAAGIGSRQDPAMPAAWVTYLATADLDQVAAKITSAGGRVLEGPSDVEDVGRVAMAADPAGAVLGLWQAGTHHGISVASEPGAVTWSESWSHDFAGSKEFYQAVFGYTYSAERDSYATMRVDGRPVAGIGDMSRAGDRFPAGTPAHWATHFCVHDANAAAARVAELGGTVTAAARDTPYGRLARAADDQGSAFSVIQLAPGSTLA
jgi:predicted enzyme related to lactoylglutathione lyase